MIGIVHRDLKPDNVILVADPERPKGERSKLLDFGIAKQDAEAEGERRTTTGVALGTPTYMSPEQCEGLPRLTDRADVYALGIMLFELLAGEPPFRAESASAIMCKHLTKLPPPLPSHVPEAVASLVRAMLAKEPTQRPPMDEIVERIDNLDAPRSPFTAWKSLSSLQAVVAQRRRAMLLLTAAGFVALLTLLLLLRGRGHGEKTELMQPRMGTPPAPLPITGPPTGPSDAAARRDPAAVLPLPTAQKSKLPGKSRGPSRIIFGTKKSNKDKKSHS